MEDISVIKQLRDSLYYGLCANLYDFTPRYFGGKDSYILKVLTESEAVHFIGGGDNKDASVEGGIDRITMCQYNPDTMAGDMIVMVLTGSVSVIIFIWRSQKTS